LKVAAMMLATKVACRLTPLGWSRPAMMSVDCGEIFAARSGWLALTPVSMTPTITPAPVAP